MVVNYSYHLHTSLLFACLILLIDFSLVTQVLSNKRSISISPNDFSTDLIQRDSPFSPTHDPAAASGFGRLRSALRRSLNRAGRYKLLVAVASSAVSLRSKPIQSRIVPSEGEYLMNVSIGTPPVPLLGIADTGSDLIWTQCKPCAQCFKQTPRLFDPKHSSTYSPVACESEPCSELPESTCLTSAAASDACEYSYSYGDRSFTRGTLAFETLTVGATALPGTIFGCGHDNGGTFDESGSGLIGLGGGPLSLVSQLGNSAAKFSYCLVPLYAESYVTSKITFGDAATVSGPGVTSTPLVAKYPDTFYYLTLQAISVGEKKLVYADDLSLEKTRVPSNTGNIIIDSGTTLSFLPPGFHDELVSALEEAVVGAERVSDPNGVMSLCFRDEAGGTGFSAPTITAHFAGADVVLQPLNTFAKVEDDMFCFTMIPSEDMAIFGNFAQMNFLVGYDLEKGTVSFKPTDCTTMTI